MRSTPAYLNPPSFPFSLENFGADQAAQDQRLKLFISSSLPYGGASCSLSFLAFFDSLTDQSGISSTSITVGDQALLYKGQRANKSIWQGETSYDQVCSSSSLVHPVSDVSNEEYRKLSVCTDQIIENNEDHESNTNRQVKWTPSTMKLMQKMSHEPDQVPEKIPLTYKFQSARRDDDQHRETNTGETSSSSSSSSSLTISNNKSSSSIVSAVRVCSDCSTNTTPLWRSGPRGPKSLCNACGIRQRKARRSVAEAAAAGLAGGTTGPAATTAATTAKSSSMSKGKEKKSRQNHNVTVSCKKKRKLIMTDDSTSTAAPSIYYKRNDKQLCNFKQVAASPPSALFPRDVEEAAILLMDLSSGLSMNHS